MIDSKSELDRKVDVVVTEIEQGQLEKAFNSINNLCLLYPQSDRVWQAYGVIASKLVALFIMTPYLMNKFFRLGNKQPM
mgnify:CR=1 FL=1